MNQSNYFYSRQGESGGSVPKDGNRNPEGQGGEGATGKEPESTENGAPIIHLTQTINVIPMIFKIYVGTFRTI